MVITEDDDWISLLDKVTFLMSVPKLLTQYSTLFPPKSDEVFPSPNVLLSRMMAAYDIHDEEGQAIFDTLKCILSHVLANL